MSHLEFGIPKMPIIAAGLAVKAKDTGRVLCLQRAISEKDAAAGMWEFPGGHIDPGETALDAAEREFREETGASLPRGRVVNMWQSGVYKGYVYEIDREAQVKINRPRGQRKVLNPDDPDQDNIETVAWWSPEQLKGNPVFRSELRQAMAKVQRALATTWTQDARYQDRFENLMMRRGEVVTKAASFQSPQQRAQNFLLAGYRTDVRTS